MSGMRLRIGSVRTISVGRVLLALFLTLALAALIWFGSNGVAYWRAKQVYDSIHGAMKGMQPRSKEIHQLVGKAPSSSKDIDEYRFTEDFIFQGLSKEYCVQVEYWDFPDDIHEYAVSVKLSSRNKR